MFNEINGIINMLHFIKIVLVLFSAYLSYNQFQKQNNKLLGSYWFVVMLYWFVNFMQGILK